MGGSFGSPAQLPDVDLKGKTVIVTGANTGIGYEKAKTLAQLGAKVILACRSEGKANEGTDVSAEKEESRSVEIYSVFLKKAIQRMKEEHVQEKTSQKHAKIHIKADELLVEFMNLDLGSLASTARFAEEYKSKSYPLDVLICNAGMAWGQDEPTPDGFEIHFQVNYLSHFLLILLLLPILKASDGDTKRIVLISSLMYRFAKWDPSDIQCFNERDKMTVYATTKLYQIMQMFSLGRRLNGSDVSVFSVHPGMVATEINSREGQAVTTSNKVLLRITKSFRLMRSPYDGALTGLHAAANPAYDGQTALYFESSKPKSLTSLPRNEEKHEILWKYTLDCLKDYVTDDMIGQLT